MRTACLQWPYLLQQPPDVSPHRGWGHPEGNKYEQVSNDGHRMSLMGQGWGILRSHV